MQIIKNREIINSPWQYQFSGTVETFDRFTLIPYQQWLNLSPLQQDTVSGIAFYPDDEIDFSDHKLNAFKIIAVIFPTFHEGRGYTQAALLRHHGYTSELRAVGAHRDNLVLMEQCGFDAFDLVKSEDPRRALSAFDELSASETLH